MLHFNHLTIKTKQKYQIRKVFKMRTFRFLFCLTCLKHLSFDSFMGFYNSLPGPQYCDGVAFEDKKKRKMSTILFIVKSPAGRNVFTLVHH